ncbi:MAG: hypothetical protein FJY97_20960 [candidate division Zixibacteria bacterium]|nr:hypothetical protein [candidate division Zixibacteria bacterium]
MVHALEEIERVLTADGVVVDIRPYFPAQEKNRREARRKIYMEIEETPCYVGAVWQKLSGYRFTDRREEKTMKTGLFRLLRHDTRWISWHFRNLPVFRQYLETVWQGFKLTQNDTRALETLVKRHPTARIRVDTPIQLNLWAVAHARVTPDTPTHTIPAR